MQSAIRALYDLLRSSTAKRVRNIAAERSRAFVANEAGATAIIVGLVLPALVGAMGLAAEISYWQLHRHAMQNAADAAAIAAATDAASDYVANGKAVTAQYGFLDGAGHVTVSVTNPTSATNCTSNCYVVTITDQVPLFLSQVVGYQGSTTVNGQPMTTLTTSAVASTEGSYTYCMIALASSGATGITGNGVPNANMNGCNLMSNTGLTCHGHNLNANFANAHGTSSGCGTTQNSNVPAITDPYAGLASNIPANTCNGNYPQEPSLPAQNQWSGTSLLNGVQVVCGDQQLTGNTTLNNTTLVIENGQLDTNGYTLTGTGLTIIFTGTNSSSYQHVPTGGGGLNISAPTSGPWAGVAMYQDPSLNKNVDISAAGNSPTWNMSGLVYLPHSSVTLSGAVGKSSSGVSCFIFVVDNVTINGTGSIFANDTGCSSFGLTAPQGGSRGTLVN
jgi:Flp pilus assembly protein TadG